MRWWDQKRTHGTVTRRYSDFVWLLDCLTKRYVSRAESDRELETVLTASAAFPNVTFRPSETHEPRSSFP